MQKEASVASLWSPNGWNLIWRRRLFVWESGLVDELLLALRPIVLDSVEDGWGWRSEQGGEYSAKSAYGVVLNLMQDRTPIPIYRESAFKAIWKCLAPSKVSGFVWMVLHGRVPTRENLLRRNIIAATGDHCCVFCGNSVETVPHLFLYCNAILQIWERILAWLGLNFSLPHSIDSLLNYVSAAPGNKHQRKGLVMIWCAVIWTIWRYRNRVIFYNGTVDCVELLEEIKTVSWKWWLGRGNSAPCLLYEWLAEPVLCMKL
jgi:hypothetical protein